MLLMLVWLAHAWLSSAQSSIQKHQPSPILKILSTSRCFSWSCLPHSASPLILRESTCQSRNIQELFICKQTFSIFIMLTWRLQQEVFATMAHGRDTSTTPMWPSKGRRWAFKPSNTGGGTFWTTQIKLKAIEVCKSSISQSRWRWAGACYAPRWQPVRLNRDMPWSMRQRPQRGKNMRMIVMVRVFHKNTFSKKEIVHTPTTPYRAYINHMQKLFLFWQV